MTDTFPSLFIGYTFFWLIIAFYLGLLGSRIHKLERKVDFLLDESNQSQN